MYIYICVYIYIYIYIHEATRECRMQFQKQSTENARKNRYGVAMTSRLRKIVGLFCKRALLKRRYSTKETYSLKEPTNRSHPICKRL